MARILIIDDDQSIGEMLQILLELNGYTAFISDRPLQAKEKILEYNADLVLLDMRLSGIDGAEVCARLKKDEDTKEVPVIMMSALDRAEQTCKASGADDFISKPFEMEELLSKVEQVITGRN